MVAWNILDHFGPVHFPTVPRPLPTNPKYPPPQNEEFYEHGGFHAERAHFFQVSIKLAQPFPAPELRTRILWTRGFFWHTEVKFRCGFWKWSKTPEKKSRMPTTLSSQAHHRDCRRMPGHGFSPQVPAQNRKNPHAHKNKLALPPPPSKQPQHLTAP